jgi:outer membrane protein with beta-barrel domain
MLVLMKAEHMHRAAALSLCFLAACNAFGGDNAINLHGGARDLQNETDSISQQGVGGLEVVVGVGDHGWAIEGQGFYAEKSDLSGNGLDSTVKTKELSLGARRTFFRKLPVRPYIGLGANWMDAEVSNPGFATISDDGYGGYAHIGVEAALLAFQVGLDVRGGLSGADLGGQSQDYVQSTIFVGLTW